MQWWRWNRLDRLHLLSKNKSIPKVYLKRLDSEWNTWLKNKYGNVSEEEALKFVTLNPAKMLHVDNRIGSIKPGKDADLVLWSDNPLSIYAKALKTYVDGICYFDAENDKKMREEIRIERARLIGKMLEAKRGGEKTQKPGQAEEEDDFDKCDSH